MNDYNKNFAPLYDKGWNDFSLKVINYFKKELKDKDVCDVSCGTGNFIKLAKKTTKSICGVDISKDFIKYAKQKNFDTRFKVADVHQWQEKNKYNVVTCFYDAVNHFNNWPKAFKNIYNSLKPDGVFIFDINTPQGLQTWNSIFLNKVGNQHIYQEGQVISKSSAKMILRIFDQSGSLIDHEEITEIAYPVKQVIEMLKKAGFKKIKKFGNIIKPKKKGREFFVCFK